MSTTPWNLAYVDQGYTGQAAADAAQKYGIELGVIKHTTAKRGLVLLPRRWASSEASPGPHDSADSPETMSVSPTPSLDTITSPSHGPCSLNSGSLQKTDDRVP